MRQTLIEHRDDVMEDTLAVDLVLGAAPPEAAVRDAALDAGRAGLGVVRVG